MTARADAAAHGAFLAAVAAQRRRDAVDDDPFTCDLPSEDERRARVAAADVARAEGVGELARELLDAYVGRLVIPEKAVYAAGWVAHVLEGGPVPVWPGEVPWDAVGVERKVRRWARRAEVSA